MSNTSTKRWPVSVKKLIPIVNILHHKPKHHALLEFNSLLEHHLKHYGEEHTLKLFKLYKLVLQQHALGQGVSEIPFCKTDKDGFPKILKPWKIGKRSPAYEIRWVMSFWRVLEVFRLKPKYEVQTIITKPKVDENLIKELTTFIGEWQPLKSIKRDLKGRLILSTKAGPNGPASIACMEDLKPLRESEDLYKSIKQMLDITMPNVWDVDMYKAGDGKQHSKLVLLSDKAGKTRVIAIADWWSNVALTGIHDNSLELLKKFPSDVTFRQDRIPNLVKGLGSTLYSADMTAFTDVFPIELEQHVVQTAYGANVGRLWRQIISNREFSHPKGSVKYAAGNPMGLLSSWPVSTITHHAVKQYCAEQVFGNKSNKYKKYKYLMLGDDSLDSNKEVYFKYLDVMTRLGVSTSLSKCTQSEDSSAEFAKRLFLNETEVTGLPITLLEEIRTKPEQFLELIRIARERGYADEYLAPGVDCLLVNHRNGKLIADILSLPEPTSGIHPLLDAKPDSWASKYIDASDEVQKTWISISRDKIFWEEVKELDNSLIRSQTGKRIHVDEYHPILAAIGDKNLRLIEMEGEYSIYDGWLQGNYREMAHVPNIDDYRYMNKGHYATKSKYLVLKYSLALASGDTSIPLYQPTRISNWELFQRGFPRG